ncbi:hypothetical protein [Aeoliella mucimassa]|uniref:Uncharacterized protein n=1 Tax=Aeoliella mucimassa TaxID=2527972 RepID=A0A518ALL9_9BACT|nr:hypothetical protein [Aeoliella mucimassa]QDU55635.1 hypothetical protein Pan181_18280 [Aeoliella mucimassa]
MKIGPSLIGSIVGAVVGVAAQIGVESTTGHEAMWFAIVIGVLTGLGARALAGDGLQRASYLRAGVVAIVAFVAILGGSYAATEISRRKSLDDYASASSQVSKPAATASTEPEGPAEPSDEPTAEEPTEESSEPEVVEPADSEPASDTPATSESTDNSPEPVTEEPQQPSEETAETPEPTSSERSHTGSPLSIEDIDGVDVVNFPQQVSTWRVLFVGLGVFLAYELARGGSNRQHG